MAEYRSIVKCSGALEKALQGDRDIVYFLNCEGFISQEVCDDVLNPRSMLTAAQKAGELVTGIRNSVSLNAQQYHTLVEHLREERRYRAIVQMLDKEFQKQDQKPGLSDGSTNRIPGVFIRYGQYLKSYYRNNPIVCDDKLSIAPSSRFVNLALIVKRGDQYSHSVLSGYDEFSESTFHGGLDQIEGNKIPLKMDDLIKPESRFILVEGPPGIGKSTLCWELCRQWDTLKSMQDFKIVLQLKLREKYVQSATSLSELFYHEDKRLRGSVAGEVYRCEGEGTLLIFDGFDETPTFLRRNNRSLIMKLISGACLPKATCLITSRPSVLFSNNYFPRDRRHIEILGFTDKSKVKFAEATFESQPEILTHFKDFIFSNPIINSLMYIPINCAIIAQIYENIRRSRKRMPKTTTQLYTILVLVLIRRHMIETGKWDEERGLPSSFNDLPSDISADLKRVSKLAYSSLFSDFEDIQLVFTTSDVGEGFQHLGLLSETKEMYVCEGAKTLYSFLHLSIQELLAAWYVSCHPDLVCRALSKVFSGGSVNNLLNGFGLFSAGMIGCYKLRVERISQDGLEYVLKCLYEAQNPSNLHLPKLYTYSINLTNSLDMYVFGYTLVHAPIQWELTVSTSFDMLVRSIADHATSGAKILGSIKKLHLYCKPDVHSLQLEKLPKSLLNSITNLVCGVGNSNIPVTVDGIATLQNLQSIYLDFEEACQNDYLLYQSLSKFSNLNTLELHLYHVTRKGMQKLFVALSNSQSLTRMVMKCYHPKYHAGKFRAQAFNCSHLIEAACSTAKSLLFDNVPFQTLNSEIASRVTHLEFVLQPEAITSVERFFNSLCCLVDTCRLPSLKFLEVTVNRQSTVRGHGLSGGIAAIPMSSQVFCNFIAILNNSLHCNRSIVKIDLALTVSCPLDHTTLSHALQRDPDVLRQKLRRAKSLGDLTEMCTVRILTSFDFRQQKRRSHPLGPASRRQNFRHQQRHRRHSCPNLLEMQSLHNIHPLLYGFLMDNDYKDFYYRMKQQREEKSRFRSRATFKFFFLIAILLSLFVL